MLNIYLVHVKGESLHRHSLLLNPIHLVVNKICLKQTVSLQLLLLVLCLTMRFRCKYFASYMSLSLMCKCFDLVALLYPLNSNL